ncbi:DNA helicase UvrD [Candidatus Microgenomates bacterium]|nr:DNA helicase UvrD [Candidatus Microgenomates bacterium]
MNSVITDLQLHSRYARAVSSQMVIPQMALWAKKKGIKLLATGDWTHPLWLKELQMHLKEDGSGILTLVNDPENTQVNFLLSGEVSCIYSQGGKLRRIHTLIFAPDFVTVTKINTELTRRGCNLMSDGRPIIGLTSIQLCEVVFNVNPDCLVIPAHCWTPWFSLFGSMSGFDSIAEAFGSYASQVFAIETGLSSNPAMNWRIKELDNRSIVSFSDAHSGPKLGREATVFNLENLSYKAIREAIMEPSIKQQVLSIKGEKAEPLNTGYLPLNTISYTIEFYPEEGKYHFTGHRNCNVRQTPEETKKYGSVCPTCGKSLTVGVMHRVEELAGRTEGDLRLNKKEINGIPILGFYSELFPQRPPYVMLVPLQEIIAEAVGAQVNTEKVQSEFNKLINSLGSEFEVLINCDVREIASIAGEKIAEGVEKVRKGDIVIEPGYDGVFGVVKIWNEKEETIIDESKKQLSLF